MLPSRPLFWRYHGNLQHILETLGNTPLVKLGRFHPGPSTLAAKVEYFNPGGSVKDRIGIAMIEAGEKAGPVQARRHDRRAHLRQHRRGSRHGRQLEGLQADLHGRGQDPEGEGRAARGPMAPRFSPARPNVEATDPRSYYKVAERIRDEEGAFLPYQYYNQANPEAHYSRPARRSGARPTARSRTGSPAWAPAARSAAPRST